MAPDARGELEFLTLAPTADVALSTLKGPVRHWFAERIGIPTLSQRIAWPVVAAGKNFLLSAPTGSGKTLAAFLPLLDRLLAEPGPRELRCLYISPLKALSNDTRRNLRRHLYSMRAFLPAEITSIRVGLRTGDTPARLRRRLLQTPPQVLLTTPESLAILLTSRDAATLFGALETVVIDEVHALAGAKRGADLALSLERMSALAGRDFQRIGLSATCVPLEEAALSLVGTSRSCTVAEVVDGAPLRLDVELVEADGTFLSCLVHRLRSELAGNRGTLIFTNTRRLAERLSWALRQRYPAWDHEIAVHHSSLATGRRRQVERDFKRGRLRAVVASTSLELGIDIGSVDNVVLIHPPGEVVRMLQRVGRGGHGPGRPRRGLVLVGGSSALFEAVVTAAAGQSGQCEALRVPGHPLDVLCQQLLGMAAASPWTAEEAFGLVRRAYPYRALPREDFECCIEYLAGRASDGRARWPTRLRLEGDRWRLRDGYTLAMLRRNIGSIVTEDCRPVVVAGEISNRKKAMANWELVGEVDDAFGDRLQAGDRFLLDGRCLEFRRRVSGRLLVEEVFGRPAAPRWHGEGWPLTPELASRLYLLRAQAAEALREGSAAFREWMSREYGLPVRSIACLADHFQWQEAVSEIPDYNTLLIETVRRDHGTEYYAHTPLNRTGNDALARVVVLRLARDHGHSSLSLVAELGFMLMVRGERTIGPEFWRRILTLEDFQEDLDLAFEDSNILRERFQRIARTGLLRPRRPVGSSRGSKEQLIQQFVDGAWMIDSEFVLLREARREIREQFGPVRNWLEALPNMTVRCRRLAEISPFVEGWSRVEAGRAEYVESPLAALTG